MKKTRLSIPKNFIMIVRMLKDRYLLNSSTIILINTIKEKYLADEISAIDVPFEDLWNHLTKKSTYLSKCIINEFSGNIRVLYK